MTTRSASIDWASASGSTVASGTMAPFGQPGCGAVTYRAVREGERMIAARERRFPPACPHEHDTHEALLLVAEVAGAGQHHGDVRSVGGRDDLFVAD